MKPKSAAATKAAAALPADPAETAERFEAALKESAPDAWKAAKKQHKGSTKEVYVAVVRAVAAGLEDADDPDAHIKDPVERSAVVAVRYLGKAAKMRDAVNATIMRRDGTRRIYYDL